MDPLVAKIIFGIGYLVVMFAIRGPHIHAKKGEAFQPLPGAGADRAAFVVTSIGNGLVPLLYIFTPIFQFADHEGVLWLGIAGALLLVPGHWLFYRSHRDLGKNWSPVLETREGHTLVTEGIYRPIRHPMYSAVWLFMIAQAMILPNWVAGFAGLLPFAWLYLLRVGKEERMMEDRFGDQYTAYRKRTGRLLPRLRSGQGPANDET